MKGLRELALSCMLFACAANTMATEIADNLLKLDPLVYFGAESFEEDEVKGLNRGRANSYLSLSSEPATTPSFLGLSTKEVSHAGQALQFSGQNSLTLQANFINTENLSTGVVLGFFARGADEPSVSKQCLFSLGDEVAVVQEGDSYSVYQQGQAVVIPDIPGLSKSDYGFFAVFSEDKIQLFLDFSLLHEISLPSLVGLSAGQIVLGNCSSSVKQNLIEENVSGLEGSFDELVILSNRASWARDFMVFSSDAAFESSDEDMPNNSAMTRAVLLQASLGAYPTRLNISSNVGEYGLLDGHNFVSFIYPVGEFLPVETSAGLVVTDMESVRYMDSNSPSQEFDMFVRGDGFWWPNPIENVELIRVECFGDSADCQSFYKRTNSGVAFAEPVARDDFALETGDLQSAYDRSLAELNFRFNDLLAIDEELLLGTEHVRLYKENSGEWSEVAVSKISAQSSTVKLAFNPRLKDGSYRVVFSEQLSSHAGVALGEEQSHEFSVTQSEVIVGADTNISAVDYQHDGKRLIVDGATLTLAGAHDYETVVVRNSGVITAPENQRISITADEIEVDATSRIDVSGRGQVGNVAIGTYTGASYGGAGGSYNGGATNANYGDFREPKDFGTGGRNHTSSYVRGGGAIELRAGLLKLDGLIQANGMHASSYGSGSGGSLLLRAETLQLGADARIEANGGGASTGSTYGGGGGGRVALYYGELTQGSLQDQLLAKGGLSQHAQSGAAGSVYLKNTAANTEELVFNNTGVPSSAPMSLLDLANGSSYSGKVTLVNAVTQVKGDATFSVVSGTNGRLVGKYRNADNELVVDGFIFELDRSGSWSKVRVLNGGVITAPVASDSFTQGITITADEIEVDATSRIDVSGRGQVGNVAIGTYTGGSYGGTGGSYNGGATNAAYGDFREPKDFGTGARNHTTSYIRGGGALELRAGLLKLDGLIQANGQHASSYGSGSGGSLLLHAETLQLGADARIEANGGGANANSTYGGGGGGRVALYYGELTQGSLQDQLLAKGGLSQHAQPGAAGSIYLKNTAANTEELVFNNTGVPSSAPMSLLDLTSGSSYSGKVTLINSVAQVKGDATFSVVSGTNGRLVGKYRNADNELVVDGFTFELDRSGSWSKVRVLNGGVITTPVASSSFTQGVTITADEVEVDATSRIDVSGRGQVGNVAIGTYTGASYGGAGGSYNGGATNASYGDFREPKDFGIGARNHTTSYIRGGGAIGLRAGLLKLDGLIQANGLHASSYGSGSGGSLLLHAETLQLGADARIEANGGGSNAGSTYGGGGGGRVALYYGELTQGSLQDQLLAKGGLSQHAQPGAAGSVYLKNTAADTEELVFNNTGVPSSAPMSLLDLASGLPYSGKVTLVNAVAQVKGDATFTAVSGTNGRLVGNYRNADNDLVVDGFTFELDRSGSWSKVRVLNGGVITTPVASNSFTQGVTIIADEIEIDATSRIDVSGRGQLGNAAIGNYSGGSYGGSAGIHSNGSTNAPYGDFREPKNLGIGGRQTSTNDTRGGGAIELRVGLLKLDGLIQANGQHASSYGSGSGGSLLMHAETLQLGTDARIEANGGGSNTGGTYGGGGGGRVALYYGELTQGSLQNQLLAKGGLSQHAQPGAAGSVYLKNTAANTEELVFNNTGVPSSAPMSLLDLRTGEGYSGKISLINVTATIRGDVANRQFQLTNSQLIRTHVNEGGELLVDGFTVELSKSSTWSKIRVLNGGVITTPVASDSFTQGITITADEIEVDATSRIDVSNKGRRSTASMPNYTGHSHGGRGGSSSSGAAPASYGSYLEPRDLGVGGYVSGDARGGGALELNTAVLKLSGALLANGQSVSHASSGSFGSGSGGSLLLTIERLELGAHGRIEANGGGRQGTECCYAGAGGGGRIAVNYKQLTYPGTEPAIRAKGGATSPWPTNTEQHGAAGTVYLNDLTNARAELIIDNSGLDKTRAATTLLDLDATGELTAKLTVINANVQLIGTKLGEVSLKDSVASVKVDEIALLQSSNSQFTQAKDVQVANLQLIGGSWNQAGFALHADSYQFANSTLLLSGAFNQVANDLIVDGFTVELSQSRTWKRVRVLSGGVITTPVASDSFTQGITITADEVEVDASSRIDVSGKGSLPSAEVGNYCGGSHGGLGGTYGGCGTNAVYGDYLAPVTFGMGGRYSGASYPNRGGGALKLVTRTFKLDGQLLANGATNSINSTVGGGAGGSLWVDTQVLLGSVTTRIQANGGNGLHSGGPGGGGRIAIYYAGLQGIDVLSQISVAAGAKTGSATLGQPGSLHLENRVVSTAVAGSNLLAWTNQALTSFNVDFINAVEPASVSAETVRLIGPNGPVAITGISAVNTVRYQVDLAEALADGAYELRVGPGIRSVQGRGMDQNGNGIEDEADDVFVQAFVVDRLPPTAPVITSPLVAPAINALTARKVTISGEREAQTAILVNGTQQVALGDGAWTVSNYTLVEGASELQVQSRDAAGNLSPASVLKFSVDSLHPSFQQYSHTGSIKEVPTSVWVRFSETGSGLDFASSSLTLKRGADSISGQLSLDGDVLRLTPNSTLLEGAYSVAVVLKDKAGNQSTTTYSFTLDYTAPLAPVVNAYPALTINKQLLISGVKENGSRVRVFNAANTQLTSICCSGTTWQYTLVLEPGDNHFTVTQTDAAGNVSPATAVQVRFDNEAPGPVVFTLDPKGSGTEVKLAWPSYDEAVNGNDIQQYRIYSAAQPFNAVDQAQVLMSVPGGSKQALVKNLTREEERYFAVVAVDQQGLLLNTVTAQAATPEDVQAPAEPLALAVSSGAAQLNLSWQASPNAAGDLAGYALYVGENNAQRIELPLSALSEGLRYSLTGLE
ncbi:MAG: Ig-like domain-containing protein, partial [Pseudomonas sp.]|nr:Ig-like domain-containing protein [Pseudomonas sp.]